MHLAYLGPKGTFSEIAARKYLQKFDKKLELKPYDSIFAVIKAVNDGEAKEGIVPIENSVEGSVTVTMDMLAQKDIKLKIVHEIDQDIVHNLIVSAGTKKDDITDIYSHQQTLAQCQHYLRKNFPSANLHAALSNAQAVQLVKEYKNKHNAAIGPALAAQEWDMEILQKNIQDYENTRTRFVAISLNPIRKTDKNKTSIVFSARKDKPGALYEILGFFAKTKLNLSKIESRPTKQAIGEYLFFIDIEASDEDPAVEKVLKEIGSICSFFKKLGSYSNN